MIILRMSHLEYENDVRALIMAFYHGVKIYVNPDADRQFDEPAQFEMGIDFIDSHLHVRIFESLNGHDGDLNSELICKAGDSSETDISSYKQAKNDLKRLVYKVLCDYTGRQLPWGTLTGIRPTKIALGFFEEGITDEKMHEFFKREYDISEDKYRLCTHVAKREREILKYLDYHKGYSLYTGIPFCPTICAYCSFSSYPLKVWEKRVDDYLEALFKEIDAFKNLAEEQGKPLTFYMGGGTPTSLSADQMDRLLDRLFGTFHLDETAEKTIEAGRPDSITKDKLEVIRRYGITRISINPQTMNQKTLDAIGRRHTVEQVKEAFVLARDCGFDNINMDLIAGLPGETKEDFAYTLSQIETLAPESLTVHALAIKRAALVNRAKLYLQTASVEDVNDMINMAFDCAVRMGQEPYYLYRQKNIAGNLENVGYAKPGLEAIYNILIMEEKQTIVALGAGGTTKRVFDGGRIERCENVKDVTSYINRIDEMIERKRKLCNLTNR